MMENEQELITPHKIIFDKKEFMEKAKVKLGEKIREIGKPRLTLEESYVVGIKLGH